MENASVQPLRILTIGHSTHSYEDFLSLLRAAGVTAIADVRSAPYSRFLPHFNQPELQKALPQSGISYVFLGKELGGRPSDRDLYSDGVADYEKMARSEEFEKGLARLADGAKKYRVAMMCSEQDPLDCHRCLLVGRALVRNGIEVGHILPDGTVISQADVENVLLESSGHGSHDFFASRDEQLALAYRARAKNAAFAESEPDTQKHIAAE